MGDDRDGGEVVVGGGGESVEVGGGGEAVDEGGFAAEGGRVGA